MSENGLKALCVGIIVCAGLAVVLAVFLFSGADKKLSLEEEKAAAVKTATIEKVMAAELETTNKGDLLEVQKEGLHKLWVVVNPFRDNERHDWIAYQTFGSCRQNTSANGLIAEGVVRVYRVGTPEWKEKVLEFFKQ